jgi:hypothetical protein
MVYVLLFLFLLEVAVRSGIEHQSASPSRSFVAKVQTYFELTKENDGKNLVNRKKHANCCG